MLDAERLRLRIEALLEYLVRVDRFKELDRETFVAETCRKAGLPGDAWKKGTTIWKFQAEVFGENVMPENLKPEA